MYTLFNTDINLRQTNTATMAFDNIRNEMRTAQLGRYKTFRRDNPGYLKSNHILLNIINTANIPFDGDIADYYLKISSIVNRLAGQMGLCSPATRGRISQDSSFYGKGINEVIIAVTDDSLTPRTIWYNWRSLSAVRVLSHPIKGYGIVELNGTQTYKNIPLGSTAVIELNIPLLMCQYQIWRMMVNNSPTGYATPTAHFITQYVIPNVLDSHLDVAILNNISSAIGIDNYVEVDSDMPFYLADFKPRIDKALNDVINKFRTQTHTFKEILANFPVIARDNLLQAMIMPDVVYTNQVIWALMLARLNCIAFLLRINKMSNNAKNDADINRIRRSLLEADSGKYLSNQMPLDVAVNIKQFIDTYIRPNL